jgi:CRISPR-associated protein (TIGR03984 family)
MIRTIQPIQTKMDGPLALKDPLAELGKQVETGRFRYLLAHAADGVIWGVVEEKKLSLSHAAFPKRSPRLRPETLWEARLFGENAEWFAWRDEVGWQAREIHDGEGDQCEYYDENQILWGTDRDGDPKDGFYPIREADMGIRHSPPLALRGRHSLRLTVRHYLDCDAEGAIYVKWSRLVDLKNGGEK